ncbi:MAG: hypothetical protein AAFY91_08595 [Bacteroidota bacterium]
MVNALGQMIIERTFEQVGTQRLTIDLQQLQMAVNKNVIIQR